ncbi:translation elongation factor G [Acidiphilium sp. CAG:727]|nr:translation elongation factor G [Acidiphilium sp. CAG:727]
MIRTEEIRNVAIIGHSGEGKTTLTEAILFNAGAIDRQGKVDDGNTVSDFEQEEIARKTSISLTASRCEYTDRKNRHVVFNLLDVPGFFDFEGERSEALAAADNALIVTGANGTLTVGTEKAIEYCLKNKIPSILFINGLDKDNANFVKTVHAIKEKYGNKIAPMIIPNMVDEKMKGFVKVAYGVLRDWERNEHPIPANLQSDYEEARLALCEAAAENDEGLLDKFFADGDLTGEEIERGVKFGVKACTTITVLGGSALKNQGIFNLMDKMVSTMLSPADAQPQKAFDDGKEIEIRPDSGAPAVVRVFKTTVDPFVGRLNMFKVLNGTVKSGDTLIDGRTGEAQKISSIYYLRGKKQIPTDEIVAGDIGAFAKLGAVATGDALSVSGKIITPTIKMPPAEYAMAIGSAKKGEEDKVFAGLKKLQEEDVSFRIEKNPDTGEMLIVGVGDTQLSVLCKKLKNKFGCDAVLTEPKVAYRETIRKSAEGEGKHKKQSGGAGQYGHCKVRFEPGAEDGLYEFVDAVVGGVVPRQFIPAVDKGLKEAIKEGVLAGYPVVNLKCTLFDGSYHPVDSKEVAFVSAARLAYLDGMKKASPCILEPVMKMDITVPDGYLGDIMGDMNKRRGRILGTDTVDGNAVVPAEAPQAEILKYATDLRSMTQGRGSYVTEFVRYEEVPSNLQDKIIAEAKKQ